MRLLNYLSYSGQDPKTNIFRALSIKLTETENVGNREIVTEIIEKYNLNKDMINTVNLLNKELKKEYRGKFKFDFCLEGVEIEKLRAKNVDNIKKRFFEVSSQLGRLQLHLEKKLREEEDIP